jgi:hypothetical protein
MSQSNGSEQTRLSEEVCMGWLPFLVIGQWIPDLQIHFPVGQKEYSTESNQERKQ